LTLPSDPSDGVAALDGKRMRGRYETGRACMPPWMVGVWDAETWLSLAAPSTARCSRPNGRLPLASLTLEETAHGRIWDVIPSPLEIASCGC
jgi:hypothetical protein